VQSARTQPVSCAVVIEVQQTTAKESKMSYRYTFTVFTPTYNRANTLPRVYESLRAQTFRDFEWLIVDDGSKDDTKQIVERWQAMAEFPIRYIYQQNQGNLRLVIGVRRKHRENSC